MSGRTVGWRVVRRTKRRRWYISSKGSELWTEDPEEAWVYKTPEEAHRIAWVQGTLGVRTSVERVTERPPVSP